MRFISILLINLLFFTGISFAQNDRYDLKFNPKNDKYALILNDLIIKSKLLDLNEKEKSNVKYLESFYLDILNKKTKEFNDNQFRIMEIVRTKDSSLKSARKYVRKNAELNLQLGYTFIEALEYIKINLGVTNFNKLMYSNEIELFNMNEFKNGQNDQVDIDEGLESTGIEEEGSFN